MHQLDINQLAPSPLRNAKPVGKHYDYVKEFIKLKRWAEAQNGEFTERGDGGYSVPRIKRRDAIRMAQWWKTVAFGVKPTTQTAREVHQGIDQMLACAYGSVNAALGKRRLGRAQLDSELTFVQANRFWQGMRKTATAIGAAKHRPTLFDQGLMALESIGESAQELPDRVVKAGKAVGSSINDGIDKVVTTAKWAGIISGGLLAAYVGSKFMPGRKQLATDGDRK